MLASFAALVCRFLGEATEFALLAGVAILLGDTDLVDLDFAPLETDGGGGRIGLPGNWSNLGGGEICFFEVAGLCTISDGSSNARTQLYMPYSSASSNAKLRQLEALLSCQSYSRLTQARRDPDIASDFIMTG